MFAFAESQGHLERALDLWEIVDPAPGTLPLDHVELLSRAAQAARFSGDRERAITLGRRALDEVDASVDPARAARLFERLGEAHFWDDETALGWYGKALALLPAGPAPSARGSSPPRAMRSWGCGAGPRRVPGASSHSRSVARSIGTRPMPVHSPRWGSCSRSSESR